MYANINLVDNTLIGQPGSLPANLIGLGNEVLSDLSAGVDPAPAGFAQTGFWPVTLVTPPYDATSQIPDGTYSFAVDAAYKSVTGTANLRLLTSSELATALAAAQKAQIAALSAACLAQIVGGYQSSALGTVHTYPSQMTDQANMTASVLSSLMPGLPSSWTTQYLCADAGGIWDFVAHTATQIQQAGQDGKAAILAARVKLATLSANIMAAKTISAVNAIVW